MTKSSQSGTQTSVDSLKAELDQAYKELERTNSELLQLTLHLDDKVEERTQKLQRSEAKLREHRDHLEEEVKARTADLEHANDELKRYVRMLSTSEARFKSLVRTIPDIVYRVTPTGEFTYINAAVSRLGYSPEELLGKHFSVLIVPRQRARITRDEVIREYIGKSTGDEDAPKMVDERRTGNRQTTELIVELRNKNNKRLSSAELTPLDDDISIAEINAAGLYEDRESADDREFIGTVGVIRDITTRYSMAKQLREMNENLEILIRERTRELENTNEQLTHEIEKHERTQKDLIESEQLLRAILNGMGAAVFYVNPSTYRITYVNAMGERLLGLSQADILDRSCCDLICPGQNMRPGKNCRVYMQKVLDKELVLTLPDGNRIPIIKHVLPMEYQDRIHHVEIIFDLSERKELERQLSLAQKMESVGQLAAGIAHEINTPIQFIGSNIHFLDDVASKIDTVYGSVTDLLTTIHEGEESAPAVATLEETIDAFDVEYLLEETRNAIRDTKEGIERITTIVQAMKNFSHPGGDRSQPININNVIENTLTVSRNEWKYHSKVETALHPELPMVMCIVGDLNQALLNIIVNAAHTNADKSKVSGELETITITTSFEGEEVVISIADTGMGIAPENYDKVFNPFFTTKSVGKGTGQGMSITYNIVERNKGSIAFTSELGVGTTFTLRFPAFVQ